jgi:hypothetical protein
MSVGALVSSVGMVTLSVALLFSVAVFLVALESVLLGLALLQAHKDISNVNINNADTILFKCVFLPI